MAPPFGAAMVDLAARCPRSANALGDVRLGTPRKLAENEEEIFDVAEETVPGEVDTGFNFLRVW